LAMTLFGCSQVSQKSEPVPAPLPLKLGSLQVSDSAGVYLPLAADALAPRRGKPYTLSFAQPIYGALRLVGAYLHYLPTEATVAWAKDSARYTVCQDGSCGQGYVLIRNAHRISNCQQDAPLYWLLSSLGQNTLLLNAAAKITGFSAQNYTLDTTNGYTLQYIASGNLSYFGYDVVRYSYTLAGQCRNGVITVGIGDTCAPGARPIRVTASGNTLVLQQPTLLAIAQGCRLQVPDGIFSALATGVGQSNTRNGTLADTTVNGLPALRYHRARGGSQPDTAYYFFTDNFSTRLTRAPIFITP